MATKKKAAKKAKAAKKKDAETFAPQIEKMLKAGDDAKTISKALGCRRGYVYIVRKNAGIAKPKKEVKAKATKAPAKKAAAKAPAKKAAAKKAHVKKAVAKKSPAAKVEEKPAATFGAVAEAKKNAAEKLPTEKVKLETMRTQYKDEQKGAALTRQQNEAIAAQERKVKNLETLVNG